MTRRRDRRVFRAGWLGVLTPLVLLVLLVSLGVWLQSLGPPAAHVPERAPPPLRQLDLGAAEPEPEPAPVQPASEPSVPREHFGTLRVRVRRWPDGGRLHGVELVVNTLAGEPVLERDFDSSATLEARVPLDRWPLVVIADAPGCEERRARIDSPGEVELLLPTDSGFIVRVTDPLGAPHAGVDLSVWGHWPARPAWVVDRDRDGASRLVAWQAHRRLPTSGPSNAEGYVRIEPFRDHDTFVDLVYAVHGERLAGGPVRVPLPHDGQRLPDLVMRSVEPLVVRAVDRAGQPLPRPVTIEVDGGPGRERLVERTVEVDRHGRADVPRHLGTTWVRVRAPRNGVVQANADGRELQPVGEWWPVGADEGSLECRFEPSRRVHGTLVDSLSGGPVEGVRAELLAWAPAGEARLVDEAVSDASGLIELEAPPRFAGAALGLRLLPVGAPRVEFAVNAEPWDEALPEAWFLQRPPGDTYVVTGEARDERDAGRPAEVEVWTAPAGTTPPGELVFEPDEPWRREWSGVAAADGRFGARWTADPDHELVVVARWTDGLDTLRTARWGPRPAVEALSGSIVLDLAQPEPWNVTVSGSCNLRGHELVERVWLPWRAAPPESVIWSERALPLAHRDLDRVCREHHVVRRAYPDESFVQLDLRQERLPVPLTVDWWRWGGLSREELDRLTSYERMTSSRLVAGVASRHGGFVQRSVGVGWPDLGLAMIGSPTRAERPGDLGRHDTWVRVGEDGAFSIPLARVERGAPRLLLLYRPRDDGTLEVLWRGESEWGSSLPDELPPTRDALLAPPWQVPELRRPGDV